MGVQPSLGLSSEKIQSRTLAYELGNFSETKAALLGQIKECRKHLRPASKFPLALERLETAEKKVSFLDQDPNASWYPNNFNSAHFLMEACKAAAAAISADSLPAKNLPCLSCGSEAGAVEATRPSRKAEKLSQEMDSLASTIGNDQNISEKIASAFQLEWLHTLHSSQRSGTPGTAALLSPKHLENSLKVLRNLSCVQRIYLPVILERIPILLPGTTPDPRWIFRGGPAGTTLEVQTSLRVCGEGAREGEKARRK